MQEELTNSREIKPLPAQKLHKIVWTCVGVFLAIAVTFPLSMWRVSQDPKFSGFHVKSLTLEGKKAQ